MGTLIKKLKMYEKQLLKKKIKKQGPTVTISSLSGAGKSLIGESIARELNLRYVSMGDIFRELAAERGMRIEQFDKIRKKEVDLMADKKALEMSMKGNILIAARISGWVAGSYADFKIWIECDYETRAKRVAAREGMSLKKAKKYLGERDGANTRRYKKLYGIKQDDMSIYDLIIDNGRMTKEQAKRLPLQIVRDALRHKGLISFD